MTATADLEQDIARTAHVITAGFESYRHRSGQVSHRAKHRFEQRDWAGLHVDALERFDVFPQAIARVLLDLEHGLGDRRASLELWQGVRSGVHAWLEPRHDAELGTTFYNSIVRRALATIGADASTEFVGGLEGPPITHGLSTAYPVDVTVRTTLWRILGNMGWDAKWQNIAADVEAVTHRIKDAWGHHVPPPAEFDILPHVFYRGTRAFVVGQLVRESRRLPLTLAFIHEPGGLAVDAVLLSEDAISILFSFTRAYFHVVDDYPAAMVAYLHEIMPRKPRNELYTALGFFKHGKTLLYRDLARHIASSDDRFVFAPGTKGMVMAAFVLPSVDVVFKVIRDRFAPPKTTTRREVMQKYELVFKHDRAGRLVDAQEFEHLAFPRDRFDPELLDELRMSCGSQLHEYGDTVEIRHMYTERRLIPLDLFLTGADRESAEDAILDWGQAIKDLAATNIFPGDLLLKNFGVTRHGRIVFYDYDELCRLDACKFRRVPRARHDDDEFGSEPWFHVGENDIFPEEFMTFLGIPRALEPVFLGTHGDLFDVAFWQAMQARHDAGEVVDILPYGESQRLRQRA